MFGSDFVPVRSQRGETLLAGQDGGITGRQRQLMRLIDGRRRLSQIAVMMPGRDLEAELAELLDAHFIMAAGTPAVAAPVVAAEVADTPPEHWDEAFGFMRAVAIASLGVMAQPVIALLEQVGDSASARSAVARWHMALRESRHGRDEADTHLRTVTSLLDL
ncbi:MAG: hypothetical protein QM639_18660 [Rhodocyclaceae bacterium]